MLTRNPSDLPKTGRLVGFDFGGKTIGVAVCDSAQTLATASAPLPAQGSHEDIVKKLPGSFAANIVGAVVGLPLNMDGSEGPAAAAARSFAGVVAKVLNVLVLLWDERLSSRQAEAAFFEQRTGRQTRASKKDSSGRTDSAAAALVLQSVLDARQ